MPGFPDSARAGGVAFSPAALAPGTTGLPRKGGHLTLDQWLLRFDPANLSVTVLVFIVLVTAILFLWTKFWPWYIEQA